MDLRRGSKAAVDFLATNTKTITTTAEIAQVATISANGDVHVGNLIAQAMEMVSKEGVITVKEPSRTRLRSPKGCGSTAGSSARTLSRT
jgi:chaperonin GroEL